MSGVAEMEDLFTIGNKQLQSRLLMGTGKFSCNKDMPKAIEAAAAQIVTVALRRADCAYEAENILNYIPKNGQRQQVYPHESLPPEGYRISR